jgi:hypothetical protein
MSATIHSITDAARKPDAKDDAGGLHHEAMIAELKAQLEATRQKLQVAEKRAESWRRLLRPSGPLAGPPPPRSCVLQPGLSARSFGSHNPLFAFTTR